MKVCLLNINGELTHVDDSISLEADYFITVVVEPYLVSLLTVSELLVVCHTEKLLKDLIRANLWYLKQSIDEIFEENHAFFEMLVIERSHCCLLGDGWDLNRKKNTGRPGYMAVSLACSHSKSLNRRLTFQREEV